MDANIPLVSANLATAIIESFLYGIFFILATTSIYLLVSRRQKPVSRLGRGDRSIYLTPMFLASICLFILITAHWAFTATRLFQAFVNYNGGTMPLAFYADLSQITEVAKTGFLMACLIICDAMIIYRLWIIWNHRTIVIIFPICTLLGLVACGAGITYQFSQYTPGENVFISEAGRWITSDCVFTLSTNVYSSFMIVWRILSINHGSKRYGGGSLMTVLATFVESAGLYTAWTIMFFASYQSHSNLQFPIVDCWSPIAGISFMLINVRVGLGWAQKAHASSSMGISSSGRVGEQNAYGMHPLSVSITRVVENRKGEDDYKNYPLEGSDSSGSIPRDKIAV